MPREDLLDFLRRILLVRPQFYFDKLKEIFAGKINSTLRSIPGVNGFRVDIVDYRKSGVSFTIYAIVADMMVKFKEMTFCVSRVRIDLTLQALDLGSFKLLDLDTEGFDFTEELDLSDHQMDKIEVEFTHFLKKEIGRRLANFSE